MAWGVRIQSSSFRDQLIAISVSICDLNALWKTRNRPSDDSEDSVEVHPHGWRLQFCAGQWSRYYVVKTAGLVMYWFRTIGGSPARKCFINSSGFYEWFDMQTTSCSEKSEWQAMALRSKQRNSTLIRTKWQFHKMAREVTLWSIPGFIVIKEPHDSIVALTQTLF